MPEAPAIEKPGVGAPSVEKPAAPAAAPAAPKTVPFEFKLEADDKFTLDQMLRTSWVEAGIRFNDKLVASYRTMSVDAIQAIEGAVDLARQKDKTAKFIWNEMTIAQLYFAVQTLNGKPLPAPGVFTDEKDERRKFIRNLPGALFDLLVKGLNEFDAHCKRLVGGDNVKNF